jgi:rubrerythrin
VSSVFAGVRLQVKGIRILRETEPVKDYRGGVGMTDDTNDEVQGEAEPLNWACTNCGYRVEGELPEKCPDCGADKEMFDEVPVPGY